MPEELKELKRLLSLLLATEAELLNAAMELSRTGAAPDVTAAAMKRADAVRDQRMKVADAIEEWEATRGSE